MTTQQYDTELAKILDQVPEEFRALVTMIGMRMYGQGDGAFDKFFEEMLEEISLIANSLKLPIAKFRKSTVVQFGALGISEMTEIEKLSRPTLLGAEMRSPALVNIHKIATNFLTNT